jgi:hypothetical protein
MVEGEDAPAKTQEEEQPQRVFYSGDPGDEHHDPNPVPPRPADADLDEDPDEDPGAD